MREWGWHSIDSSDLSAPDVNNIGGGNPACRGTRRRARRRWVAACLHTSRAHGSASVGVVHYLLLDTMSQRRESTASSVASSAGSSWNASCMRLSSVSRVVVSVPLAVPHRDTMLTAQPLGIGRVRAAPDAMALLETVRARAEPE